MDNQPAGVFRVLSANGVHMGMAFCVSSHVVATCHHVVKNTEHVVLKEITTGEEITVTVDPTYFCPSQDIAYLIVDLPEDILPVQISPQNDLTGLEVVTMGRGPDGRQDIIAKGKLDGIVSTEVYSPQVSIIPVWQIDAKDIDQGFSGAPVWDAKNRIVIGMVRAIYTGRSNDLAYAVLGRDLIDGNEAVKSYQQSRKLQHLYSPVNNPKEPNLTKVKDYPFFYGRERELATLSQWAIRDGCRVIPVLGLGGIGKTVCIMRFIDENGWRFQYIFGRDLQNDMSADEYLNDCLTYLSDNEAPLTRKMAWDAKLDMLLNFLIHKRCLILMDSFENVIQASKDRGDTENLDKFNAIIDYMAKYKHQSCLIITSREELENLESGTGKTSTIRNLKIDGIDLESAQKIFAEKNVNIPSQTILEIHQKFSGHPLVISLIASSIHKNPAYIQEISRFTDIRKIMESIVDRLSDIEFNVVMWMALEREPVPVETIQKEMLHPYPIEKIHEAVISLVGRSILVKTGDLFGLQNILMEYLTEKFIQKILIEIQQEDLDWFNQYYFLKANAKDYIRNSQVRLLLRVILRKLTQEPHKLLPEKLRNLLSLLHKNPSLQYSYAPANLLHLILYSEEKPTGLDFSGFTLRNAYLAESYLTNFNFQNCRFENCVFSDVFGWVISIAFDPTGRRLAAGDYSGTIKVWDIENDHQIWMQESHNSQWVTALVYSPDGRSIASGGQDGGLRIWDAETGEQLFEKVFPSDEVSSLVYSPDGKTLVAGLLRKIVLIDIATKKMIKRNWEHEDLVTAVAFHPDGKYLVSSSADNTIRFWDLTDENHAEAARGLHHGGISYVSFSPNGKLFASCDNDGKIILWDAATNEPLHQILSTKSGNLTGHSNIVYKVIFSYDSQTLASCSLDTTIKHWSTTTYECIRTLQEHLDAVWTMDFHPTDPDLLVSGGSDFSIHFWELSTGNSIKKIQGIRSGVARIKLNPDQKSFATASADRTIRLWDLEKKKEKWLSSLHQVYMYDIAHHPTSSLLAACSDKVFLFNSENGKMIKKLNHPDDVAMEAVTFSPEGDYLFVCDDHGFLNVWDMDRTQAHHQYQIHDSVIYQMAYIPNTNLIASVSDDCSVRVFDTVRRKSVYHWKKSKYGIMAVAASPDGHYLAAGGFQRTIWVWDALTWKLILTLKNAHDVSVQSLAFRTDSKVLISGGGDQKINFWNLPAGEKLKSIKAHDDWVSSLCAVDVDTLFSGSDDGTIKVWNLNTYQLQETIIPERLYENMDITGVEGLTSSQVFTLRKLGAKQNKV